MKANELRIGNIIDKGVIDKMLENDIYVRYDGCFNYGNVSPIKLTEEWLLRFGFKKAIESEYTMDSFQRNNILLWNKNLDFSVLIFTPTRTEIKYVHQLQNLYFALTGEELNV